MRHALLLSVCLLAAACQAPVSPACSDKAYLALATKCAAAAVSCRQQGGSETECGALCDGEADDWQARCGQ